MPTHRNHGLALPAIDQPWLRVGVLALVFFYLLSWLPNMVWTARHFDKLSDQKIARWDDSDYQALAINLLHGYGYTETLQMPIEAYQTQRDEARFESKNVYSFYRAPGFAFLLAGIYAITGESTLAARLMIGSLIWLTAVLILWIGDRLAGWVGSLAAGLAGYYLLNVSLLVRGPESFYTGRVLSEPLTAFLVALFASFSVLYLQKRRLAFLYLACLTLAGVVLTRANFLTALPLYLVVVYFYTRQWKPILIAAIILFLPVIAWSAYASVTRHSFVLLTTQGSLDFPRFNNQDVITGFGPDRINQGGWQPGFIQGADGELIVTNANAARAGENGWIKGLQFWISNPKKAARFILCQITLWFMV